MTRVIDRIAVLRQHLAEARRERRPVRFVPTMGALHAGHIRLIDRARKDQGLVVVSVFVNPMQFDRADDLAAYPRTLEEDLALCDAHGVDVVFAPAAAEMYPAPAACAVDPGPLAAHLCGTHRPGHFRGVATVVLKLFQIVQPDTAYFGEKDAQQLAIIRRMVRDFDVPVEIVGVPTVRESDGVALSSRNGRLDPDERRLAPLLYTALLVVRDRIAAGATDVEPTLAAAHATIPRDPRLRLEYLDLVDPEHLQPLRSVDGPALAAGALWIGATRLIDNVLCTPGERP